MSPKSPANPITPPEDWVAALFFAVAEPELAADVVVKDVAVEDVALKMLSVSYKT
jgi:hypothetical protein